MTWNNVVNLHNITNQANLTPNVTSINGNLTISTTDRIYPTNQVKLSSGTNTNDLSISSSPYTTTSNSGSILTIPYYNNYYSTTISPIPQITVLTEEIKDFHTTSQQSYAFLEKIIEYLSEILYLVLGKDNLPTLEDLKIAFNTVDYSNYAHNEAVIRQQYNSFIRCKNLIEFIRSGLNVSNEVIEQKAAALTYLAAKNQENK